LLGVCLARESEIVFAYAHGSFVQDGPFRDLDVAVFLDPAFLPEADFRYEMQLQSRLENAVKSPCAVDARILNKASLSFQYHAIRGRLLLDRKPDVRVSFSTYVVSRYLDIEPILRHHTKEAFALDPGS